MGQTATIACRAVFLLSFLVLFQWLRCTKDVLIGRVRGLIRAGYCDNLQIRWVEELLVAGRRCARRWALTTEQRAAQTIAARSCSLHNHSPPSLFRPLCPPLARAYNSTLLLVLSVHHHPSPSSSPPPLRPRQDLQTTAAQSNMPEQTQPAAAAAQAKSKHSHTTAQAQPAPRKVRFNVGEHYIPRGALKRARTRGRERAMVCGHALAAKQNSRTID